MPFGKRSNGLYVKTLLLAGGGGGGGFLALDGGGGGGGFLLAWTFNVVELIERDCALPCEVAGEADLSP